MSVDGVVPNGEDCTKWLIYYCNKNGKKLPKYYLHTANHKQRVVLNNLLSEENVKTITLNEKELEKIINESAKKIINEIIKGRD